MVEYNLDARWGTSAKKGGFGGVSVSIEECREVLDGTTIGIEFIIDESIEYWSGRAKVGDVVVIQDNTTGWGNSEIKHLHVLTDIGHGGNLDDQLFMARPVFDEYLLVSHGSHADVYKLPSDTEYPVTRRDVSEAEKVYLGNKVTVKAVPDAWLVKQFGLENELVAATV